VGRTAERAAHSQQREGRPILFPQPLFREPNGILFEIANRRPGFATDEPLETLGERLAAAADSWSRSAPSSKRPEPL